MRIVYFPLEKSVVVDVKLPNGALISVDLNEELAIYPSRMRDEIVNQPSRYATWSTATEIARRRVEKSEADFFKMNDRGEHHITVDRYKEMYEEYNFLYQTKKAFSYKKDALLQLLGGSDSHRVIQEYCKNLSNLRALLGQKACD